jgi:glutathione S-transferase
VGFFFLGDHFPMKLYYTESSPYANCVRMLITELGIEDKIEMVINHPFDNQSELVEASPLGKVPCLIDQGELIGDSQVICDYLDANYNNGELLNPIYASWHLRTLYSIVYGLIDTCVASRIEKVRQEQNQDTEFWHQRHGRAIENGLNYISEKLFLIPDDYTVLHIVLMSALGYLKFRHPEVLWDEKHSALSHFYQNNKKRNSVVNNPFVN